MAIHDISYEEALLYQLQMNEVMQALRSGKSKHKDAKPENLQWSYSHAVQMNSDFSKRNEPLSVEELIERRISSTAVSLRGKIGHWWGVGSTYIWKGPNINIKGKPKQIGEIPKVLFTMIKREVIRECEERKRLASLTTEQRQSETNRLLKELAGSRGFASLRFRKR